MPFAGNNIDAAWLAGIIDGEGSINSYFRKDIARQIGKGGITKNVSGSVYGIFLQIVNTDINIINKVRSLIDRYSIHKCIRIENRKPIFHITISQKEELLSILEAINPYLCSYKRKRSEISIKYLKSRKWGDGKGHRTTQEEVDMLKEIQEIKQEILI